MKTHITQSFSFARKWFKDNYAQKLTELKLFLPNSSLIRMSIIKSQLKTPCRFFLIKGTDITIGFSLPLLFILLRLSIIQGIFYQKVAAGLTVVARHFSGEFFLFLITCCFFSFCLCCSFSRLFLRCSYIFPCQSPLLSKGDQKRLLF